MLCIPKKKQWKNVFPVQRHRISCFGSKVKVPCIYSLYVFSSEASSSEPLSEIYKSLLMCWRIFFYLCNEFTFFQKQYGENILPISRPESTILTDNERQWENTMKSFFWNFLVIQMRIDFAFWRLYFRFKFSLQTGLLRIIFILFILLYFLILQ